MNQQTAILLAATVAVFLSNKRSCEDDDRANKRRKLDNEMDTAIALLEETEASKPGRGRMQDGREPVPRSIPRDFNSIMIDWVLTSPGKCISAIGLVPKEFLHIVEYVETELNSGDGQGRGENRQCKPETYGRLFVLLWFLMQNTTMRCMELIFFWAKTCINDDIKFMGRILLKILKREMGSLFPNRAERDAMRLLLPRMFAELGVFFLVDSSKITNVDSTNKRTRTLHWCAHKGFGGSNIYITDVLGRLIAIIPIIDGNGSDMQQLRESDWFMGLHGYEFDLDEVCKYMCVCVCVCVCAHVYMYICM
jgi:hypothetical protein